MTPPGPGEPHAVRRLFLRYELVLVVLVALAVLVPGIWRYSLVDPWETHYGEVAREMLQDHDLVHTKWTGCYMCEPGENEGFRSKPVLSFWMMAAGLRAVGVAADGGYSGELTESAWTMVGIRLPFIFSAVCGLALLWWMLRRLLGRRAAWLGLLGVGSAPMFCMMSRNAIPDMPMVACTIGAIALFIMAVEDGERPITQLGRIGRFRIDARHAVLALAGGFVVLQAAYYATYFSWSPLLGIRGRIPNPMIWLPALMLLFLGGLSRDGWTILRLPSVLLGGVIAAIANEPMPRRTPGQSVWRHAFDDVLRPWDRHAPDRYAIRGLAWVGWLVAGPRAAAPGLRAAAAESWVHAAATADGALAMAPIATMRQLYLIGMYFLLGVSVLAKGPPGLTVVAGVAALHVVCFHRWRALFGGAFELKRGLLLLLAVAIPWHIAMFLKAGPAFLNEYLFTHILNRASSGVDNSPGSFRFYTSQLGHGMWLWAALLPAALGAAILRAHKATREGRVRFTIALWAIAAMAVFCLVQTKFNHYILPAVPPLALLVALFLDDILARRDRLHPLYAALGIGIVLLVTRDLMFEPERWIEMFVFRYDRAWPTAEPYAIDPSDGILGLGLVAAAGLAVMATPAARAGVWLTCGAALAICLWALQIYMPIAGTHWGMREAARTYYEQRTIYGHQLTYFGLGQLHDDWHDAGDTWSFDTFIPDTIQVGQPMTVSIELNKPTEERVTERALALAGTVTAVGDHTVTLAFAPGERAKLEPWLAEAKRQLAAPADPKRPLRGRPPVRTVDADRLIAWQMYWRGELFWSGGEIWGWRPEMKTYFGNPNNIQFQKYLGDRTRAPAGRRYFVLTEGNRLTTIKSLLPPQARDTYEVLDQTSNKFGLGTFVIPTP